MRGSLQYLQHHEIDRRKWNDCIAGCSNRLIYAYSFYLDAMSPGWGALVMNDYEAVMPLTVGSRLGFRYLYQPAFTQQLGIFSSNMISEELIGLFLDAIRQRFRFCEIHFNYQNAHPAFTRRNNFILDLQQSYDSIAGSYHQDLKNNLRIAAKGELKYRGTKDFRNAFNAFCTLYAKRMHLKQKFIQRFAQVCALASSRDMLVVREVYAAEQMLASAILLHYDGRLYLLQNATFPDGRECSANHYLLDALIREFSGTPNLLDFEGSSIPGIAHFYANFGAVAQPYFRWEYNELPWPLSFYKRKKCSHFPGGGALR